MPEYSLAQVYWFSNVVKLRTKGKWVYEQGVISFICPFCGTEDLLESLDYEIDITGEVSPIYVCRKLKCVFTAHIGLKKYKEIVL